MKAAMATPIAVTIAGSDSSGGAGIQADLKTFSALGVYGASVIAALTAQNTEGVAAIHEVPPAFVAAQVDAVFSDLAVGAVKIGMLGNADVIATVAAGLERRIDNGTQFAGGGLRIGALGQRRNHADAVGTGRNHRLGVRRRDAGDAAGGEVADAAAQDLDDLAQSVEADRRFVAGLRRGAIDAADAHVIEERKRRRGGLFGRADGQTDERSRP